MILPKAHHRILPLVIEVILCTKKFNGFSKLDWAERPLCLTITALAANLNLFYDLVGLPAPFTQWGSLFDMK
jgi:hypothetical protein